MIKVIVCDASNVSFLGEFDGKGVDLDRSVVNGTAVELLGVRQVITINTPVPGVGGAPGGFQRQTVLSNIDFSIGPLKRMYTQVVRWYDVDEDMEFRDLLDMEEELTNAKDVEYRAAVMARRSNLSTPENDPAVRRLVLK